MSAAQVKNMTKALLKEATRLLPNEYELEAAAFGLSMITANYITDWIAEVLLPFSDDIERRDKGFFAVLAASSDPAARVLSTLVVAFEDKLSVEVQNRFWVRLKVLLALVRRAKGIAPPEGAAKAKAPKTDKSE